MGQGLALEQVKSLGCCVSLRNSFDVGLGLIPTDTKVGVPNRDRRSVFSINFS